MWRSADGFVNATVINPASHLLGRTPDLRSDLRLDTTGYENGQHSGGMQDGAP